MNATAEGHRQQLLDGLRRFVVSVRQIAGVRRIAVLGSIVTTKPNPKDIDVLVVVADHAHLTPLATCSRRLQGHAQSFNRCADVFLADERATYKLLQRSNTPSNIACTRRRLATPEAALVMRCRWADEAREASE